jgi:insulysin
MLFNFYNANYSANLMKLVVYGQLDIDTLTKEVEEKFADVKDYKFNGFKLNEPPYYEKTYGKIVKIVPVKDKRTL